MSEAIRTEAAFLLERLHEINLDDDTDELIRDWNGHVEPSIARLRGLLSSPPPRSQTVGYCTDCENSVTVIKGRCGCGSGRVILPAVSLGQVIGSAWTAKAALLRSRGKNNTMHDIEQAADYLDAAAAMFDLSVGSQLQPLHWFRPKELHETVTLEAAVTKFGTFEAWGGGGCYLDRVALHESGAERSLAAAKAVAEQHYAALASAEVEG